jgi:hypothetical protein
MWFKNIVHEALVRGRGRGKSEGHYEPVELTELRFKCGFVCVSHGLIRNWWWPRARSRAELTRAPESMSRSIPALGTGNSFLRLYLLTIYQYY